MNVGGPLHELEVDEAMRLCVPSTWHDQLLATFSEFGFCHTLADIPIHPLLLDAELLETSAYKLRRVMQLARYLATELHPDRAPVRHDHLAVVAAYRDAPRRPLIGRPDCVIHRGTLKILELNIGSGVGGVQEIDTIVKAYRRSGLEHILSVSIQSPFDSQIELIRCQLETVEKKSVVIVPLADFGRLYLDQSDRLASQVKERLNVRAKTVFPEAMRTSTWLTDGQEEFGLFYQDACFLHEPSMLIGMREALLAARTTRTIVLGDPLDIGVDDKGALALVSEYLDNARRGASEFSDLVGIVPWTRLMRRKTTSAFGELVNLKEFVLENKDRLVLKRCASHVGKHVYIGSRTDDALWRDIVERTYHPTAGDWIVQEFVHSDQLPFWFRSESGQLLLRRSGGTIGPFLFGDASDGWLVRIQGETTSDDEVLALPTDGNIGITTVAAVDRKGV